VTAANMYLSIAGLTDTEGGTPETVLVGATSYIQISGFVLGASTSTPAPGTVSGKVNFSYLGVDLAVGLFTPALLKACATGTSYTDASLIVQTSGVSGKPVTTEKYDFGNVFVRSMSIAASGGGGKPMQHLDFEYGSVRVTYTPYSATGTARTPTTFGWDLLTAQAS